MMIRSYLSRSRSWIRCQSHASTVVSGQNRKEYVESIRQSAIVEPSTVQRTQERTMLEKVIPMLCELDPWASHLFVSYVPHDTLTSVSKARPPSFGYLEVRYPFSTNPTVRNVWADLNRHWNPIRLGQFYEAMDAITGEVAYRHAKGVDARFVTAGHYDSMKLLGTSLDKDIKVRAYVVGVGTSSIEIRTDVLQADDNGEDQLVNFAHTAMVALSPDLGGKVAIPPLLIEDSDSRANERLSSYERHKRQRKIRRQTSMALHQESLPPTESEVKILHDLFRQTARVRETGDTKEYLRTHRFISQTEEAHSLVVFSESRNLHGKLFGGFIAQHAFELAYFTIYKLHGKLPVPLGFDDMVFEKPVSIGDLVRFSSKVVHAEGRVMRVWVRVEVLDPSNPLVEKRTNRLSFVFLQPEDKAYAMLPETYPECLSYLNARRWQLWQGPSEEELYDRGILSTPGP